LYTAAGSGTVWNHARRASPAMAKPGVFSRRDRCSDFHALIAQRTVRHAIKMINPNSAHASTEPMAHGARHAIAPIKTSQPSCHRETPTGFFRALCADMVIIILRKWEGDGGSKRATPPPACDCSFLRSDDQRRWRHRKWRTRFDHRRCLKALVGEDGETIEGGSNPRPY